MSRLTISASRIFDGDKFRSGNLIIENNCVVGIFRDCDSPSPDVSLAADWLVAPGFVDLQVNGGGGILFNDVTSTDDLRLIADAHAHSGTTAILPTLISGTREQMRSAMDLLHRPVGGIAGLHLEGPFINERRRGIHPRESVIPITDDDVSLLLRFSEAPLLVTLAPEITRTESIRRLAASGIRVFLGHSEATAEEATAAFAAGASGTTHLFNAMSQLISRAPGLVGATLSERNAYSGIIADGHHVHPCAIRAALAAKGAERLFLVSDAMPTVGSETQGFIFEGQTISLRDGRLTNDAGTLAGAHLTMLEAVRFLIAQRICSLEDALRMATTTPAQALGQKQLGRLAPGSAASFLILDGNLRLRAVWREGAQIVNSLSPSDV